MLNRGSLSIEFAVVGAMVLVILVFFLSIAYAYIYESKAFVLSSIYVIRNNNGVITEDEIEKYLNSKYINVSNGSLGVFSIVKEKFTFLNTNYLNSSDYIVFITDTGSMYHRKNCPTVKMSLKPVRLKGLNNSHGRCSICHP
ncbi:MAG: hypothetical protein CSB16_01795 [Clostridiales bacterium]|nr:MAG: hypothetical protein CSB16_01795 [Clostridiales bacterium]